MTKIKTIAYGKIGQSIIFNSDNWGSNGGNNESPVLLTTLANLNPDITFYIIGKSDFSRIDATLKNGLFKHNNVIDVWANFGRGRPKEDAVTHVTNWFKENDITPDVGLIYTGPHGRANIPEYTYAIRNPDNYAKPLEMFVGYCAPIIHFLNESDIPWACLVPDPRYYPLSARDLANQPKVALSQINLEGETTAHISDKAKPKDIIETASDIVYSGLETVFLLDKVDWRSGDAGKAATQLKKVNAADSLLSFDDEDDVTSDGKTTKFMVVCNQGSGKFDRGKLLKEYVLDHVKDVEVYGKWEESYYEDTRFKGPLKFNILQNKLKNTKYTFMIPIERHWATAKWCEMAHYGIIPFMHPDYDSQNNVGLPDFLRVKDSKELFEKIDFLEKNQDEYEKLKTQIMNLLTPEMYNGQMLSNVMVNTLKAIV